MSSIYCIIECLVIYNDGRKEIRRPTYSDIAVGLPSVNQLFVKSYLRENLRDVYDIQILDVLYFTSKEAYEKYIESNK
jgi:hypothetical protein